MRTARLLTISRNAGGGVVSEDSFGQTPPGQTLPPPPVDRILDFLTHTCEEKITTVYCVRAVMKYIFIYFDELLRLHIFLGPILSNGLTTVSVSLVSLHIRSM